MAKRSQIAVGQEWAYSRSRSHYIGNYGYEKVVIEAIEPHEQSSYSGRISKTEKGLGVLVKAKIGWSKTEYRQTVVQLSQLFIPWAEYEVQRAEWEAQREIAAKQYAIAKAEREEFQEKVYQPAYKEFINAVEAISGKRLSGYTEVKELPIEVLKAITELAKEKAVA